MSWSISVSGTKAEAIAAAVKQSIVNCTNGVQTTNQGRVVEAIISAVPGTHVSGTIAGHNGGESMETAHGNLHVNLTGWTERAGA